METPHAETKQSYKQTNHKPKPKRILTLRSPNQPFELPKKIANDKERERNSTL